MANTLSVKHRKTTSDHLPLVGKGKRLLLWKKAKGIWKKRKPDPIKELNKIRSEWS